MGDEWDSYVSMLQCSTPTGRLRWVRRTHYRLHESYTLEQEVLMSGADEPLWIEVPVIDADADEREDG